jgi:hypothetical protein
MRRREQRVAIERLIVLLPARPAKGILRRSNG